MSCLRIAFVCYYPHSHLPLTRTAQQRTISEPAAKIQRTKTRFHLTKTARRNDMNNLWVITRFINTIIGETHFDVLCRRACAVSLPAVAFLRSLFSSIKHYRRLLRLGIFEHPWICGIEQSFVAASLPSHTVCAVSPCPRSLTGAGAVRVALRGRGVCALSARRVAACSHFAHRVQFSSPCCTSARTACRLEQRLCRRVFFIYSSYCGIVARDCPGSLTRRDACCRICAVQGGKIRTVNQLTLQQFEAFLERVVERKLLEMVGDPDRGLELKPSVKSKLRRSLYAVQRGERGVPASQMAIEHGLKWPSHTAKKNIGLKI